VQKDAFYENLERIYMKVPKHDTKLWWEISMQRWVNSMALHQMKKQIIMDGEWWILQ
jgi:hypothetical protein